jgi:predicted Zn-dependent protease
MAFLNSKPQPKAAIVFGLVVVVAMGLLAWLGMRQHTPREDEKPAAAKTAPVKLSQSQEVVLGLQAVPQLEQKYGGLGSDAQHNALVNKVGQAIVARSVPAQTGIEYHFYVLAEPNILNAFALPGGQIFITTALLNRLQTEGQLAAILAHQIAHSVKSHGAKHVTQGLTNDALITGGDTLQASMVGQLAALRYSTAEETEADALALKMMSDAGYDPNAFLGVLKILANAYYAKAQVEFFTTHPNDPKRLELVQSVIAALYPTGVPKTLSQ